MKKHRLIRNITRILTGSLLAASIMAGNCTAGFAAAREDPDMKRDAARDCSIHVTMQSTVEDQSGKQYTVKLDGGQLELIRAAEVTGEAGNYHLSFIGPFSDLQDPVREDSDLNRELADKLNTAAGTSVTADEKVVVQTADVKNGAADFSGLPLGLYLIRQKTASSSYDPIDPFLVTVPRYDGAGRATYDAVAAPKIGGSGGGNPGPSQPTCWADPPVRKIVDSNKAPANQEFFFEFKRLDPAYPMPADSTTRLVSKDDEAGTMILKVVTDKKTEEGYPTGVAEAGNIYFHKIGDYHYTYRELTDADHKKYNYEYDTRVYYITYSVDVIDGFLGIKKIEVRLNDKDGKILKTLETDEDIPDRRIAGPEAVEFTFTNSVTSNGGGGGGGASGGGGGTGRGAYNFGGDSASGGDPAGVLGANRETGSDGSDDPGVLGADRDPQAVLGATRLPQTGQLWWPVPILLIAGLALIGGGIFGRRKDD